MNWMSNLNKALDYIENNLDNDIAINKIASICLCSEYNIQRIFSVIAGVTIGEYIRKRRLTKAGTDLREKELKVLDLALIYGYESAEAFTKAFKAFHGITPTQARNPGNQLKVYQKLHFSMIIRGGHEMQTKIVEQEAFKVIGIKRTYDSMEEAMDKIPSFWNEFAQSNDMQLLETKMNGDIKGLIGLSNPLGDGSKFDYYICVNSTEKPSANFVELTVPKAKWMVFEAKGKIPDAVQETTKKIFQEFFPNSDYEYDNKPEFELYPAGNPMSDSYITEIWVPVKNI